MPQYLAFIIVAAVAAAIVGGIAWQQQQPAEIPVTSFEECVNAGYLVMESYPPQCRTPDGETFTQDIGNELEKSDLIRIDSPRPTQTVGDPIEITGQARGTWFFEANFPVYLEDAAGERIASAPAQAQGEWMTEEFVPFRAQLDIPAAVSGSATLVLEKANPSGLPEHEDALRIPIVIDRQSPNAL